MCVKELHTSEPMTANVPKCIFYPHTHIHIHTDSVSPLLFPDMHINLMLYCLAERHKEGYIMDKEKNWAWGKRRKLREKRREERWSEGDMSALHSSP